MDGNKLSKYLGNLSYEDLLALYKFHEMWAKEFEKVIKSIKDKKNN